MDLNLLAIILMGAGVLLIGGGVLAFFMRRRVLGIIIAVIGVVLFLAPFGLSLFFVHGE